MVDMFNASFQVTIKSRAILRTSDNLDNEDLVDNWGENGIT